MKRIYFCLLLVTAGGIAAAQEEQLPSPRVSADNKNMYIEYGQPSKRGRIIFGELVPYGVVWRTGANECTVLTLKQDALFGGKAVKKGDYVLFTRPGKDKWQVILNSELVQWGASEYENRTKEMDVVRVEVQAEKTGSTIEQLTVTLQDDALVIEWEQTRVRIPVVFQ